jgi:hypothetical protein
MVNPADLMIPAALAAELEAAAEEEQRPVMDVLRDAVQRYRSGQRWRRGLAYGAGRARESGLSDADVRRVIAAYRAEKQSGHRS